MKKIPTFLLALAITAVLVAAGCSRREPETRDVAVETCAAVRAAVAGIAKLEGTECGSSVRTGAVVRVKGMDAAEFRRILEAFPGREVHVWMPGEREWYLVGSPATNRVSLADAMEAFAADTNCTVSVAELFASYAGTRDDILPAFSARLEGDVLPEWFVSREIPEIRWLDTAGIDEDIGKAVLSEIRSVQVVRREILRGNMLAAAATDKKGEERATEVWARAYLRNPNDPMLLERIENLNRNARGFLAVCRVPQALKCYETIVLIRPGDAAALHNFGVCLRKIGRLDLANKVLERARKLSAAPEENR